jgi:hypothetical protein
MLKQVLIIALLLSAFLLLSTDLSAQCSMCKAVVESSVNGGSKMGLGLNSGILYIMGIPYILLVVAGVLLFRKPIMTKLKEQ